MKQPLTVDENLFGRIAVQGNYLRQDQLEECLAIQRSEARPRQLGEILLERGYIDEGKLRMILEIRRKKARRTQRKQEETRRLDGTFGRLAIAAGLISLDDLEAAILEQQRLDHLNLHFRIGEILVTKGTLKAADVLEILRQQGKRLLVCPVCDIHYNVKGFRKERQYQCTTCLTALIEPKFLDTVAADAYLEG